MFVPLRRSRPWLWRWWQKTRMREIRTSQAGGPPKVLRKSSEAGDACDAQSKRLVQALWRQLLILRSLSWGMRRSSRIPGEGKKYPCGQRQRRTSSSRSCSVSWRTTATVLGGFGSVSTIGLQWVLRKHEQLIPRQCHLVSGEPSGG